jgi:internalin A
MRLPRVRFTVRRMMVLVLILGCGLGWVVHRANVQRDAVAAIERGGGNAYYDWQFSYPTGGRSWHLNKNASPNAPKWLVKALGPDYFGHVKRVYFRRKVTDATMEHIGRLDQIESLQLEGLPALTDAGMVHLRGLTRLRNLVILRSPITGAGLANVSGLTRLEVLRLTNMPFNDADLRHLEDLKDIRNLDLGMFGMTELTYGPNRVTSAGVRRLLSGMPRLEYLRLNGSTQLTSDGLACPHGLTRLTTLSLNYTGVEDLTPIRKSTGLTTLWLMYTPIDDNGLAPIAEITGLRYLALTNTRMTDAGLKHLRNLPNLSTLWLQGTRVTDAGMPDVAAHSQLTSLSLGGTEVSDAGLARLCDLTSLELLDLSDTRVSDVGLNYLSGMKLLTSLRVGGTQVTDAAIAAFQKERPKLQIIRESTLTRKVQPRTKATPEEVW